MGALCHQSANPFPQVHCRVLLPVGQLRTESHLPSLHCQPLTISLAKVLRPPAVASESFESFLHTWTGLPLQVRGRVCSTSFVGRGLT
jgi:hypothetical protein